MQDTRARFITIILLTLASAFIVWPTDKKPEFLKSARIRLGIDLAGGAELRYRILYPPNFTGNRGETAEKVVQVLQRRINTRGLKEPRITSRDDQFVVLQLAGLDRTATEDYRRLIGQVGNLELKSVGDKAAHDKFNATGEVPHGYEQLSAGKEFAGSAYIRKFVLLKKTPIITGQDIATATHDLNLDNPLERGKWAVNFTMKTEGAKRFDDEAAVLFNQKSDGKPDRGRLAILLDGAILSAPVVNNEVFEGKCSITGSYNDENEAKELAIILRSGSLPVPIGKLENDQPKPKEPEADTFVGPSLGQDSIFRGLLACGVSFIGIALFMMVYYRAGGIIATLTLALNLLFLMTIMSFFQATLTMPGIAGIVLTAGMAVDANILVYERIREELAKGKTLAQAFEAGHDRAFVTIVDSNLTTLIAAFVLFYLGTGPVQGFAVTLMIGILTTLFSVLFCGRTFLKMLIAGGTLQEMRMMKLLTNPKYDFVKYLRPAILGSALLIAGAMAVFVLRYEKNLGIEFRGGSVLTFSFSEPADIRHVREQIQAIQDPETKLNRYPTADVITKAEPGANLQDIKIFTGQSRIFEVTDRTIDVARLRSDIEESFKGALSPPPFHEVWAPADPAIIPAGSFFSSGPAGAALFLHIRKGEDYSLESVTAKIKKGMDGILSEDRIKKGPEIAVSEEPGSPEGYVRLKLLLPERDLKSTQDKMSKVRAGLQDMSKHGHFTLSTDPFLGENRIGRTVAEELRNTSVWAMIVASILMIAYIAVRFSSWRFGVAAVIALVHDALVSIGVVAVLGAVVPASWGLSFDMNMTFVAAILTIIGYSINDTIVIFDRIRENLAVMRKESFPEIINASVNQTLSRTILTALTVWITSVVLYVSTMTSGGGIAEFSLPLIIGVLAGSYSTVYIASPIVLWWYRGQKPQLS